MRNPRNKKRKRSASPVLEDEEIQKPSKENTDPFTSEIEFKFLLSDRNTAVEGLERFIQSAENETSTDIISGYCRSSQSCSELFDLIDPASSHLKTNEVALVFRCLELILTRIQTDLLKYSSTAEAIVQKILAGHMGQVYSCLQEQNKSKTIKACLQLLTAMVSASERAKKAVQSRLNFAHVSFPALFRRRNRKDPTDVRSCAVLLTLSFLVDSDLITVNSLVQQKSFIQQTIAGLKYDRHDLVLDVLATLLDKVVTFPGISKTDKVKLFSETVLKQLCELYDWQGPTGWLPASKKKKMDEKVRVIPEGFSEDQETVANVCHEFLVELCCSRKNGLNFYDKTFGIGHRNHNQLLEHLVAWLIKKLEEHKKADLIIEILCACPDLIKATLTNLCPSLMPRWSDKWRELMIWVTDLYRRLPDIPPFLEGQEYLKNDDVSAISVTTVFCLPPANVAAVVTQGLKHEDIRVRDRCAHLVQILARKACAIRGRLALDVTAARADVSAYEDNFVDAFCARVMKALPPTSQLFICVDKIMQMMSAQQQKMNGLETTVMEQAESTVDLFGHASVLLQVLGLYQTLIPSLLSERPKDLAKLIDMVGCLHQREPAGKVEGDIDMEGKLIEGGMDKENSSENVKQWLPQLYLLKLLSDNGVSKISLGREGLMEKLLISASENDKFRDFTVGLVCKMLQNMQIFCEHIKELHLWLDIAMTSTTDHLNLEKTNALSSRSFFTPVTFLARCLATLINNPSPYMDRVMEAINETCSTSGSVDNTRSEGSESAIEAILLMDDEELNNRLDKFEPIVDSQKSDLVHLPFSPLTIVALDSLHHEKTDDTQVNYVSKVLVHLLHSISEPDILARIVTKSGTRLPEEVGHYFQYWAGGQPKTSISLPLPAATFGIFVSALMYEHFGLKSSHGAPLELSNQMREMSSWEKLIGLKQILLYVGDILKTSKQSLKCAETIKTYLHLATSLSDLLLEEDNHSDSSSQIKGFLSVSKNVVDDDVLNNGNVSTDELDVFDVLFSQIMTSSENVVADGFKCVLINPALKAWLFKITSDVPQEIDKKSPKKQNKTIDTISESVSRFLLGIITKSTSCSWIKSEMDLVEEYVSLMVKGLASRKLSLILQEACSHTLQSVSSLLDLRRLSQCVIRLLELPLSSLISRHHDVDGSISNIDTKTCQSLCELLKSLKLLIENEPSFISNVQLSKLIHPSSQEMCFRKRDPHHNFSGHVLNGCIKINTSFSFEASSSQKVSAFAAVFELLPHCVNESLREFVIFVLTWLPEMAAVFRPSLFHELFKSPLTILKGSVEERLFISIIKHVKGCFLLYEEWLSKHVHTVITQRKWSFITVYLETNVTFAGINRDKSGGRGLKTVGGILSLLWHPLQLIFGSEHMDFVPPSDHYKEESRGGGYTETVAGVKQTVRSTLKKFDAVSLSQSLPSLKLLSLAIEKIDPAFQQLLTDKIADHIKKHQECQLLHFTVLEISARFCMGLEGQSSQALVLELAVVHLTYLIVTESAESSSLKDDLVEMAANMVTKLAQCDWRLFVPCWLNLVQNTITSHHLTDAKLLNFVANMAEHIFLENPGSPATENLFEQCVGHTMFQTVMSSAEFTDTKVGLVKLLHILGELQPSCYKKTEMRSVLMSAYTASLSLTDQRLLQMMERSCQSLETKFECPTLWGKSALDHQEVSKVLGPSLHREAPSQAILEQLNSGLMQDSILHFPVRRLHSNQAIADATEFKARPECYDPAFFLRLFVQILSPDKQVPLRAFVEKDCLSYLLIALSSHDLHIRLLAYQALNDFYLHTDGSRWHDKMEMTFILDLLNASRVKDGQKLPFVVALFLARTVKLLLYPADPMYIPIFRFLMARPELDLGNVPEFYKLFYSTGVQYKHERNWMLSLACDGMRETSDYWLYQKKFIFKILLSFYNSVISDAHSQELILLMVKNACKEKSVAVDLVKNHGLMPWLAAAVTTLDQRPEQVDLLCDIIHSLWLSLMEMKYLTHSWSTIKKSMTSSSAVIPKTGPMEDMNIEPQKKAERKHILPQKDINHLQNKATDSELCFDSDENSQDVTSKDDSPPSVVQSSKSSVPTMPKSTAVEMALVTKSLIWHLNHSSVGSLLKVLEVLHGMTSGEPKYLQPSSSMDTSDKAPVTSYFQNLINLSPIESCLLLYHIANVVQQISTADTAASVLKGWGVNFDKKIQKLSKKSGSRKKQSNVKNDISELPLLDVMDLEGSTYTEQDKSSRWADESGPEFVKDPHQKQVVSDDNKRHLLTLFHDIVRSTRTLEFV